MTANLKARRPERSIDAFVVATLLGYATLSNVLSPADSSSTMGPPPKGGESVSKELVKHFPGQRSLGALYVQDAGVQRHIETFYHWIDGTSWEYFGEARGEVTIPAGKRLWLIIGKDAWKDLSPLLRLRPDDLFQLSFSYVSPGDEKAAPDDRCMHHLAHLTGLRVLDLSNTGVTAEGLKPIASFKSLERLTLPPQTGDAGLTYVAQVRSLRRLYFKQNKVTNAGLAHLAKLDSLEELELGGEQIGDEGLVHVAKLPSLRYLLLWSKGFSDAGMAHLRNCRSLGILNLMHLPITDTGLAHLSALTGLNRLDLYDTRVTDAGLVHLKRIPSLKMLNLGGIPKGHITDKGAACLGEIKSLEYIDLPSESVTDVALTHLSGLKGLRHLHLPIPHYINPKDYTKYYTEKGLAQLSKLTMLEELHLGGPGVTDAGMAHIGRLANLKKLDLFGCPITGKGLAKVTKLRSLRELWLFASKVALSDLAQLNAIPSLTYLRVQQIEHGSGVLDIDKLTQLEKLTLSLKRNQSFRDEDLACLAKFVSLKWLQGIRGISDAGMADLAGLTSLERLNIGGPGLTDNGLAYLVNMKELNHLSLTGDFTDRGLRHLGALRSLRYLNITSEGAFSNAALDRLRKMLPNLQVFRVVP